MKERSTNSNHTGHRRADRRRGGRVISLLALLVAVAAVALTVATSRYPDAFHRAAAAGPSYTEQQRAEAKLRICAAFNTVRTGVSANTKLASPGGEADIVGSMAVAANARVSLFAGGQYLHARLEPAAPDDLAASVRRFADTLMDVGAAATAGIPNTDPAQGARLRDADAVNNQIMDICK